MEKKVVLRQVNKDPSELWINLCSRQVKLTLNDRQYTFVQNKAAGGVVVWCQGEAGHMKMKNGKWAFC